MRVVDERQHPLRILSRAVACHHAVDAVTQVAHLGAVACAGGGDHDQTRAKGIHNVQAGVYGVAQVGYLLLQVACFGQNIDRHLRVGKPPVHLGEQHLLPPLTHTRRRVALEVGTVAPVGHFAPGQLSSLNSLALEQSFDAIGLYVDLLADVHAVANRQTLWCPQAAAVANVQVEPAYLQRKLAAHKTEVPAQLDQKVFQMVQQADMQVGFGMALR